jgi:hypothetical protein
MLLHTIVWVMEKVQESYNIMTGNILILTKQVEYGDKRHCI